MLHVIHPDTAAHAALKAALTDADLPVSDLDDNATFYSLRSDAAFGGLAVFGDVALLRSLVVAERGKGTGSGMLAALIAQARSDGVRDVWLLTTSAEPFFAKHGFVRRDRQDAPPAVAATRQFKDVCPDSAALMHRRIA